MDEIAIRAKMQEVVDGVRQDMASIRTGRATPALVQDIVVTTYGGTQKLKIVELASITTPDARTILISPWDKSTIPDISHAIAGTNVGLVPISDPEVIRINLPALTTEDKNGYVKLLHQKLENGHIMVRRIRQEAMEDVKHGFEKKDFGEDENFRREVQIQKITDEYVAQIDHVGKQKEEEILAV